MDDSYFHLERFIKAQENVYPVALKELQEGHKRSHWMWYIFPQHKSLGFSYNSKYFGISGIEEADAYLRHPILGQRLREVCETILELPVDDAQEVFGPVDSLKLKSSMTLFNAVSSNDVFARVLEKFFSGKRDYNTLKNLDRTDEA